MPHYFADFLMHLPPDLAILLMAILPIVEKFALSVGIGVYHMSVLEALSLVVIGNMIPVIVILLLAEKFHVWISAHDSIFGKAWVRSVAHAQAKFARYEKYGLIGLMIFLSFPSPLNGAFITSIIAFILGYPMHKSLPYIFAGIIIGNFVMLALTTGFVRMF